MAATIAQDNFTRADQAGLGTTADGETWLIAGAGTGSIASNRGQITNTSGTGANRLLLGGGTMVNGDIYGRMSISSLTDNMGFVVRRADTNNYVQVAVANNSITVRVIVSNVGTNLTPTTGIALAVGVNYQIHVNLNNNVYSVNVWLDGTSEPGGWICQTTDGVGAATVKGQYGPYAFIGTTNDVVSVDSFLVTSTPPTIYIATTGNDSTGNGSSGNPYLTIKKGDTMVPSGGTVRVRSGTYNVDGGNGAPPYPQFSYALQTVSNGTPRARILYISDVREGAKVISTGANHAWRQDGNYVDVVFFDITSANANWGLTVGNDFCTTQRNFVHDMVGQTIEIGQSIVAGAGISHANFAATNNWAIGNRIVNIYPTVPSRYVHAFYHSHAGGGALNNIVCNTSGGGLNSYHSSTGFTFANNLCINCRNYSISCAADHLTTFCTGCVVVNNIIRDNRSDGDAGLNYAIYQGEGTVGAHNYYDSNIIYGGNTTIHFDSGGDTPTNTTNVDPLMVNYRIDGKGDYRLLPGSPALNAGNNVYIPLYDYEGKNRPQGSSVDIGPYETVPVIANQKGGLSLTGA